jgi:hypothetical protein
MENFDIDGFTKSLEEFIYEEKIYLIEEYLKEIDNEYSKKEKQGKVDKENGKEDSDKYYELTERLNELRNWHDELENLKCRLSAKILNDVTDEFDCLIEEYGLDYRIQLKHNNQYHAKYGRFNYIFQPKIYGNNSGIDIRLDSTLNFDEYECALRFFADTCGLYFMQGCKFIGVGISRQNMAKKMMDIMLTFNKGFYDEEEKMRHFDMQIFEAGLKGFKYDEKIELINSTRFLVQNYIEEWTCKTEHYQGNNAYIHKLIDRLQTEYQKFDSLWVETIHGFLNEALRKVDDFIAKQGLDERIVIRHIEDNEFVLQVYELRYLSRSCSLVPMADMVTGQFIIQIIGNRKQKESYRDINKALAQYLNFDYTYGLYLNIEVDSSKLAERLTELLRKAD